MAFVRKKGNQVVIVQGERDPESKKVQQRTLFVIYSKAEALAATGDSSFWFQQALEKEFPDIRFDWKKLNAGIKEHMTCLPDLYEYKRERVNLRFRKALVDFARELLVSDPQMLMSSARVLQEQRLELEYLRNLIDWRLKLCDQEPSEWNADNPFYWKTLGNRREASLEGHEELANLYEKGEYDKAESLAKLLIECWENFASGYNYLGLIALERSQLETAREWFEKGRQIGRSLFPKRFQKDSYWSNLSTRPYIRALIYLAQTHNLMGGFNEALRFCEKLEKECNQEISAMHERISIYLNIDAFDQAVLAAKYVHNIYPKQNLPLAFALYEVGAHNDARVHFLNGAIRFPRAARMLCGYSRLQAPKTYEESEDHNHGIDFLRDLWRYLDKHNKARRYFKEMLKNTTVSFLMDEAKNIRAKWKADRSGDRTWFIRRNEIESIDFAESKVGEIWPVAENG